MLVLFLLACPQNADTEGPTDTGAHDDSGPADSGDSSGDTGDTGDTGETGDTDGPDDIPIPDDNITKILGDCEGLWKEPEEYGNQLVKGDELHRYTLADPEAVCNDGTRAVMYVRPYTNEALEGYWEIHVQGGGSCGSWEDCASRYCGLDYYDQSKMSSSWAPDDVEGFGIFDADSANLLSGANQAYFYYCSSDSWSGSGQVTYTPETEDYAGWPSFTMFERGHTILAAGIAELQAGVTADGGEAMPRLSDAELVVFNGTSAGASGVRVHTDWLRDELAANGTEVVAIIDAANDPPLTALPEEYQEAGAEVYRTLWDSAQAGRDYLPWMDQSCWDHYQGTEDEYLCWTDSYFLRNHVTTPFFVRQDLRDMGGLAEAIGMPEDDYEVYTRAGLLDLATVAEDATEEITMTPGAYGPNCAQHVALEMDDWWRVGTVEDDAGTEFTFQDAVMAWYSGDFVQIVDDAVTGEGDGPRSHCAPTDDER